jgi:ELWxxDGT repeat protein
MAGHTLVAATLLTVALGTGSVSDTFSATPGQPDFYKLNLPYQSALQLSTTGLTANTTLKLLDSSGNTIQTSTATAPSLGGTNNFIINTLGAGTYYLEIIPPSADASTTYTLNYKAKQNLESDIVWRSPSQDKEYRWYMNGLSFVSSVQFYPYSVGSTWYVLTTGSFDLDGVPDIVWANTSTSNFVIWFMNRDMTVKSSQYIVDTNNNPIVVGTPWFLEGAADFNYDGLSDLVWYNNSTGQINIWYLNGNKYSSYGTVSTTVGSPSQWLMQGGAGDMNGDNKPDLIWKNTTTGAGTIWLLNGLTYSTFTSLPTIADLNWSMNGNADFTQDGKTDILWHNSSTGQNVVWTMNGTSYVSSTYIQTSGDTSYYARAPYLFENGSPLNYDLAAASTASAPTIAADLVTAGNQLILGSVGNTFEYYKIGNASGYTVDINATLTAAAGITVQVVDANGNVINNNPTLSTTAAWNIPAATTTYYLKVTGSGLSGTTNYKIALAPVRGQVQLLSNINPGTSGLDFAATAILNGTEVALASGVGAEGIWTISANGTPTKVNSTVVPTYPYQLVPMGSKLYFAGYDPNNATTQGVEVYSFDGTTVNRISNIGNGNDANPSDFAVLSNTLYFAATDGSANNNVGTELYKYDGTSVNLVKDINSGTGSSNPSYLTVIGSKIVFGADDGSHGNEPWVTDGTGANTSLLKDVYAGSTNSVPNASNPGPFVAFASKLYFQATDSTNPGGLWTTDGTTANTSLVASTDGTAPYGLTPSSDGTKLFFASTGVSDGTEPRYISSGAPTTVATVADIYTGANSSYPSSFSPAGATNEVFFTASPDGTNNRTYRSTGSGATQVSSSLLNGYGYTNFNSNVYFTATDNSTGYQVYYTPVAGGAATKLTSFNGNTDSYPYGFTPVTLSGSNYLQFMALSNAAGFESHSINTSNAVDSLAGDNQDTNTTVANYPVFQSDSNLDTTNPAFQRTVKAGGYEFFVGYGQDYGYELFFTDGTTLKVVDINRGINSSNPSSLAELSGQVLFSADDGSGTGAELWRFDPVAGKATLVADLNTTTGVGSNPTALVNTYTVTADAMQYDLDMTGTGSDTPKPTIATQPILFFAALDTNGHTNVYTLTSPSGTPTLVKTINTTGDPVLDAQGQGLYYFVATDGTHGYEMWRSDGTSAGTIMLADINSGSGDSFPYGMMPAEANWYYDDRPSPNATVPSTYVIQPVGKTTVGTGMQFFAFDGTSTKLYLTDGYAPTTTLSTLAPPAGISETEGFFTTPTAGIYKLPTTTPGAFESAVGLNGYQIGQNIAVEEDKTIQGIPPAPGSSEQPFNWTPVPNGSPAGTYTLRVYDRYVLQVCNSGAPCSYESYPNTYTDYSLPIGAQIVETSNVASNLPTNFFESNGAGIKDPNTGVITSITNGSSYSFRYTSPANWSQITAVVMGEMVVLYNGQPINPPNPNPYKPYPGVPQGRFAPIPNLPVPTQSGVPDPNTTPSMWAPLTTPPSSLVPNYPPKTVKHTKVVMTLIPTYLDSTTGFEPYLIYSGNFFGDPYNEYGTGAIAQSNTIAFNVKKFDLDATAGNGSGAIPSIVLKDSSGNQYELISATTAANGNEPYVLYVPADTNFTNVDSKVTLTLLSDIVSGSGSSNPRFFVPNSNNQTGYFVVDTANGTQIWSTNGTAGGTGLVQSVSNIIYMDKLGSNLMVWTYDSVNRVFNVQKIAAS